MLLAREQPEMTTDAIPCYRSVRVGAAVKHLQLLVVLVETVGRSNPETMVTLQNSGFVLHCVLLAVGRLYSLFGSV